MEPSAASPAPSSKSPTPSVPRRPLPKYTTIDLENDLPELYSTSLNPNLRDPDLTLFYNQSGPPFYNYKKTSPPPSYPNSVTSRSPPLSPTAKYVKKRDTFKYCLIAFFTVFVILPFLLLVIFYLIPEFAKLPERRVD